MKDNISINDFGKLDLRVGEIVEASIPEWSRKLIELTVNLGEELGKRTIFTGVRQWYDTEFFVGKKAIFVTNLEPKKMGDKESQGMMMMCDVEMQDEASAEAKPVPIFVEDFIRNGTKVR